MTAANAAAETFDPAATMGLSEPAQRWLSHAIAPGTPLWGSVELTMRGQIKLGRWRSFTARQVLTPPGGYIWAATAALAALYGHLHHRGMAAAAPGAAFRQPQALAGLVLEVEPGTQVRRRPFITGQVSSRQAAMASRSRPAGPGPARSTRSGAAHPARPACSPP
jgi:hypothetical protein